MTSDSQPGTGGRREEALELYGRQAAKADELRPAAGHRHYETRVDLIKIVGLFDRCGNIARPGTRAISSREGNAPRARLRGLAHPSRCGSSPGCPSEGRKARQR